MPLSIRPYRRFLLQCSLTYNASLFQGQVALACAIAAPITPIVVGCSSEGYSRMCRTTDSPYTQVFACQAYYAS